MSKKRHFEFVMAEDNTGTRLVSYEQVKTLVDFMGQNIQFATGSLRTLEARQTSKKLWAELTKMLNDCRLGTKKTADGWSKYWSDFKNKLKNKVRTLNRQKPGFALDKTITPLTKLERKALVILAPHFEKMLSRTEAFVDKSADIPPEVKLETFQENNEYCKDQMENSNDRLSGVDRESEDSAQSSNEDYMDDTDLNSNDPLVHNLYPKWLIEVEKKRADAELLRATAEENRAKASAKSAEAALIQAEALKRLAEAAVAQANAIAQIAAVLESRAHTDDVLSVSSSASSSMPGYRIPN
ncbi:uncharacterized protein LOC135079236 isoform X1 [Ostrinia nubilalis]|uniref:uncharacterized protein LOC135079236 isoform X1 n=1 Tax=Ostrinia nubilalis TaxID=29057 RepID=UPI003082426E